MTQNGNSTLIGNVPQASAPGAAQQNETSTATGITDSGIIFGTSCCGAIAPTGDPRQHAFYYDPSGTFVYGGANPLIFGSSNFRTLQNFIPFVSPQGYVAGSVPSLSPFAPEPLIVYAPDGTMMTISTGTGPLSFLYDQLIAGGVNDSGQVVGEEQNDEAVLPAQPFVYEGGTVYALDSLVVNLPSGGLGAPTGIEKNGVIFGSDYTLTPTITPEPTEISMLAFALLLLHRRWRTARIDPARLIGRQI